MKTFFIIIITIVTATLVIGLIVAGSPHTARLARFDQKRTGDLSQLQWGIIQFWQAKGRLPDTLEDLRDDVRMSNLPADPQIGNMYEYQKMGTTTFSLCANFSLVSEKMNNIGSKPLPVSAGFLGESENWQHGAGRTCFERTIDPDYFRPTKQ